MTWAQKVGAGVGFKMMFDWSLQFNWFDDGNDEVALLTRASPFGSALRSTMEWNMGCYWMLLDVIVCSWILLE